MKLKKLLISLLVILTITGNIRAAEDNTVRIAIIDTGISTDAIDPDSMITGKNYILDGQSTEDLVGHGTAVASIIVGSETAGITGVCPEAVLVPLVFYSQTTDGETVKGGTDMVAQLIRDAIDIYDCDIINFSAGDRNQSEEVELAIRYAEEKGILVVCPAGNDGLKRKYYPAAYDSVLCVGSYNAEGTNGASFSNRHDAVDILAPGVDLTVADIDGSAKTISGTSFSTAYISGLAAKLMMENPMLTAEQVQQILCASAKDLGDVGFDNRTGWGAVDEEAALTYVREGRQFRDVKTSDWFFSGAKSMASLGLMKGTDAVNFTPQQTTSRAMLWVMLHRMDGQEVSANASTWYSDAQDWVVANSIADGKDPNGVISREEITLTLWHYAQYKGMNVDMAYDLTPYPDASSVSAEAVSAMKWACGTGIINGMDGLLAPAGNTTRAQIATILTRFLTLL